MFGLMGKVQHWKHHMLTSTDERDVVTSLPVTLRRAPGAEGLYDLIVKQERLTYATWRPIHQLTLEAERLQMARACYVIRKLAKPESILSFHVDAVYYRQPVREAPPGPQLADPRGPATPEGLLRLRPAVQGGGGRAGLQGQRGPAEDGRSAPSRGVLGLHHLRCDCRAGWQTVDPFEQVAENHGFLVDAPPGYGKSHLLRQIRERLESVAVLAPTHVAARSVGGMTVHRFLIDGLHADWLLIDEYSMLSPDLCAALEHRRCKIITLRGQVQLPPVVCQWRGQPSMQLSESRLLGLWAGFRRVGTDHLLPQRQLRLRGLADAGAPGPLPALLGRRGAAALPRHGPGGRLDPLRLQLQAPAGQRAPGSASWPRSGGPCAT